MWLEEFLTTHRTRLGLYTRYGISGITAVVIQVLGFYIWVSVLGLTNQYLWGVALAYGLALVVAFVMQKYWTFRDYSEHTTPKQMSWYIGISLGNLGLKTLILSVSKVMLESQGFNFFHVWYLVVQVVAIGICTIISFFLNRRITFRSVML